MPAVSESRYLVQAGWSDVPHIPLQTQRELLDSTPPYLRAARSEGAPSLGSGAIFPIPWEDISVTPFPIPDFWPRAYGLDVGWKMTAAIWAAWDPSDGTQYCYSEYRMGQQPPSVHTAAIGARGMWIPGAIDPAARGRTQDEGRQLITSYEEFGLTLTPANNKVRGEGGGLDIMWQRLVAGRIKVFRSLTGLENEYRVYRRDENGNVVKKNDHGMDAWRYVSMTGPDIKLIKPAAGNYAVPSGFSVSDSRGGY